MDASITTDITAQLTPARLTPARLTPEFKPWSTIRKFKGVRVEITEKIHGTNAQIHIFPDADGKLQILAAKRTAYVGSDAHFGFGRFVADNAAALMSLGFGRHYGEWVGPGIGASYNLKEKNFVLFNPRRYVNVALPDRVSTVPLLYSGEYSRDQTDSVIADLQTRGSSFAPGWMHPEGVVLYFPDSDQTRKFVFDPEETGWNQKTVAEKAAKIDFTSIAAPFLQPIRLEKLLMRDEKYLAGFPKTIRMIAGDYLADLQAESVPPLTEQQCEAVQQCSMKFIYAETTRFIIGLNTQPR